MASSSKKKTTMAKIMRENRLRERRVDKQAKKDARKRASAESPDVLLDPLDATAYAPASLDATAGEPGRLDTTTSESAR
ncbi:MAG TPA: hypothetical protein VK707_03360 [Solirubrobacteraceae bacterium]|jgi:hypothetical protein|nr:hypothetical protein [Solirubrobacteraceae bacterium]